MKRTKIVLRGGGVVDLDAVMDVMTDSFDPRYGEAWTATQCAGLMVLPGVWLTLAEGGSGPIGFALARQIADEAELLLLAVRRDAQRRGVGAALLEAFAAEARHRGADRLHLEVRDGNEAIRLYERVGFTLAGRRRNYYSGPDGVAYDALTLARIETAQK